MQPSSQKTPIYQKPIPGQAVTSVIAKNAKTPQLKVKFSNVYAPFFYPNSPTIPRYSITCLLNPEEHWEFLQKVCDLEQKEGITDAQTLKDDVAKDGTGQIVKSGNFLMKFQTREPIPVIVCKEGFPQVPAELKQEISFGDFVSVTFDVLRYTKKVPAGQPNKGISYQPKMIHLYPQEEQHQKTFDEEYYFQ